jgi:hypothetical protein
MGLVWLVAGVTTMLLLPDTMLERTIDYTWFAIMLALLGMFILALLGMQAIADAPKREAWIARRTVGLRRFGVIPLTVFFIETPLRETYAHAWNALAPGWNNSLGVTLLFAATVALIWFGIVRLWSTARYVGSMEWWLVKAYRAMRAMTDKPDALKDRAPTV